MRVGIRVNGRGEPHPADRPPPDRRDHAGVLEPRDAPARGGPAVQSRVTQGVAEGRAILIAGAIGMVASLSLASPVMARSTARASAMAHLMARASAVAHSTARASMMAHLTARASARAHSTAGASAGTTCADRLLAGGSYGDVTVTPGHWCMVGFFERARQHRCHRHERLLPVHQQRCRQCDHHRHDERSKHGDSCQAWPRSFHP